MMRGRGEGTTEPPAYPDYPAKTNMAKGFDLIAEQEGRGRGASQPFVGLGTAREATKLRAVRAFPGVHRTEVHWP